MGKVRYLVGAAASVGPGVAALLFLQIGRASVLYLLTFWRDGVRVR